MPISLQVFLIPIYLYIFPSYKTKQNKKGAIIEENEFWVDCYFILMAMGYALTSILFGRWSYKWYHLFSKQSDYGALMDDMDADIEKL